MRKLFSVLLVLLMIGALFSGSASAAEAAPEIPVEGAPEGSADAPEGSADPTTAEMVVDWLRSHTSDLLAGSTLLTVLAALWAMLRKLYPWTAVALQGISDKSAEAFRLAEDAASKVGDKIGELSDSLAPALAKIEAAMDKFEAVSADISAAENERRATQLALKGVTEMLYAIIDSSRVPESVKERSRLERVRVDAAIEQMCTREGGEGA